jgi:transcriptional regulator with XRE-family HTH domain
MDPNTVIDHFGGLEETAKALGITKQAVSNWRKRRTVPELRLYQLTAMLKDKNEMLIWQEEKMEGKTLKNCGSKLNNM